MNLEFRPPRAAIDLALARLKVDGIVHPEAEFHADAPGGRRHEVAFRDPSFLRRLGQTAAEAEIVDAALELLRANGLIAPDADYDRDAFEALRREVGEKLEGPWTSLTPTMERLIYALTAVRRPGRLVELGSYWGYTLAWFAGPCLGPRPEHEAERIIGVEVDLEMTELARAGFAKLSHGERVELIGEDARTALERLPGPFDLVYLETKDDDVPGLYLTLLKQIHAELAPGAWVIAHDSTLWAHREELEGYLAFVRDEAHFSASVCFDVDDCGLELSIR